MRQNRYSWILQENGIQSSIMALAKKYKGLGILWEHRYYGESLPFQDKFSGVVRPSSYSPPKAD